MGSDAAAYHVYVDEDKNALFITVQSFLTDEVLRELTIEFMREVLKLKPGFSVIANHAQFKPTTPKGTEVIKRGQKFLNERGVKRIIRIANPAQITAKIQFDRLSRESYASDVEIIFVNSMSEAMSLLKSASEKEK